MILITLYIYEYVDKEKKQSVESFHFIFIC